MNKCAVIIPIHKLITRPTDRGLLTRSAAVFSERDIIFIAPDRLEKYAATLEEEHGATGTECFANSYFRSVKQYSRLLTSEDFYRSFSQYSHICICQLDVLSIRDELDYWMAQPWDFVGAPIFSGYGKTDSRRFLTTLNGGFSLRNVDSALRVIRSVKFRYSRIADLYSMERDWLLRAVRVIRDGLVFNYNLPSLRPLMPEDLFWTYVAPRNHDWFRVPAPETARFFAFDKHPRWLWELNGKKLPQAIHAWDRFDQDFVEKIYENISPIS